MTEAQQIQIIIDGSQVMRGFIAKELRRRDFRREKEKDSVIFTRHTVGLGGVYVFISKHDIRVVASEVNIDEIVTHISELRALLEEIDEQEFELSLKWRSMVK